jgi:hypothetical protein
VAKLDAADGSDLHADLRALFFFNLTSDRIYAVREEQQYKPRKMMTIDETPNEIQTRNKYAEKIARPRLLWMEERKREKRSATKTQERCNLGYGRN